MNKTSSEKKEINELTRVQELVYELRVSEVMTPRVITVSPESTMAELMSILRINRISGTPVVREGKLVGIISIEDLVKAYAARRGNDLVGNCMTRKVVAVRADELAVQAVNLFAQYGYGRLPVLDQYGTLAGILTGSDITRGLLRALSQRYHAEEIRRYRASHIFEDIDSADTTLMLRYHVAPRDFDNGGQASSKLKRTLQRLGANPALLRRVTISAYEAEMNLVIHATHGGEMIAEIGPHRILLRTEDDGPGIEKVEEVFNPGFTTAADWVRELGFGAGMGLSNIKRYSDNTYIESSPATGTRLYAIFKVSPIEADADETKG